MILCMNIILLEGPYRPNAILFQGPPICHLPTGRLFAYATHFDAHPLAIEWISDNTFNFVFESKTAARNAQQHLQKSLTEEIDEEGFVTAKSIPVTLWPPEQRINATLGKGEGLKGVIRMRWAKKDDVKKKGAKKQSDFYKKYGNTAGKEVVGDERNEAAGLKRQRRDDGEVDEVYRKSQLDDDLDAFLAEGDEEPTHEEPPSPPSKMYSDYISSDGRTLLERTSLIRVHPADLASRITAPLPHRAREKESTLGSRLSSSPWENPRRSRDASASAESKGGRGRRGNRPKKSQQDLDDELENFLKERD